MKRILSIILCVLMLCLLALPAAAEESGDYQYSVNDDGTATITKYIGSGGEITIPDTLDGHTVTAIDCRSFYRSEDLKKVTIPGNVSSIGDYAFYGCDKLASVELPYGLESIGESAFDGCVSLVSVIIPDSVSSIGDYAFAACDSLSSVTIPGSVTNFGISLFNNCGNLTSVTLKNGITSIGERAFYYCSRLPSVDIPDSVTSIGKYAFNYCGKLKLVRLGSGVTKICSAAFGNDSIARTVYYNGTRAQWDQVKIENYNNSLKNAVIVCKDESTVTYDGNGGEGAPKMQVKTAGKALTLSSTVPTREGYTFLGWATAPDAAEAQYQPNGSYTEDADITLYAVWALCGEEEETVIVTDGEGSALSQGNIWIVSGVAVLAVAAVVTLVVVKKKKPSVANIEK